MSPSDQWRSLQEHNSLGEEANALLDNFDDVDEFMDDVGNPLLEGNPQITVDTELKSSKELQQEKDTLTRQDRSTEVIDNLIKNRNRIDEIVDEGRNHDPEDIEGLLKIIDKLTEAESNYDQAYNEYYG